MAEVVRVVRQPTRVVRVAAAVGPKGDTGTDGASAYDLAVTGGFVGTQVQWLASLQGADGTNGSDGVDGASAYQLALTAGFVGTLEQWLASHDGTDGADGASAYELAVAAGFVGDQATWLASLQGTDGTDGVDGLPGAGVPAVGAEGDVVTVVDGTWTAAPPAASSPAPQTTTLPDAVGDGDFPVPAYVTLLTIAYTGACRLRLYRTAAGRTADTDRPVATPYPGGAELVYEYIALGAEHDEAPPFTVVRGEGETALFYRVDGGPVTITLTSKEF